MVEVQSIENETARIRINVDIDSTVVDELKTVLDEVIAAGCRNIIIDASGVEYVNSSGLGTLIGANSKLKLIGGALEFHNITEDFHNFMENMNLDREFILKDA